MTFRTMLLVALQVISWVDGLPFLVPAFDRHDVPWSAHATNWTDVNTEYRLVYSNNQTSQNSPQCPNTLLFGFPGVGADEVGRLGMASISQDGYFCAGPDPLTIVRETVVRDPNGLSNLGLDQFRQDLETNRVAFALSSHGLSTDMLIGWHASFRACGAVYYPQDTFYFFIREASGFGISFPVSSDTQDVVSIPPNMQALALVPPDGPVCLLVNPFSTPDSYVTLTRVSPSGQSSPTVLVPSQDTRPTPSSSRSPVSGDSSPSPPTVQIPLPNASTPPQSSNSPPTNPSIVATSPPPVTSNMPISPLPSASGAAFSTQPSPSFGTTPALISPSSAVPSTPFPTILTSYSSEVLPTSVPVESKDTVPEEDSSQSETNEPEGNAVCFPAAAVVTLASGKEVPMHALQVGDVVLTPEGPSPIIFFTHSLPDINYQFVRLVTTNGSIILTAGHYVPLWRAGLRRAGNVGRGDWLLFGENLIPFQVKAIDHVYTKGLYNPQTRAGWIIVNGFVASTYTTAIDPLLAHGPLLAPIRAIYALSPRLLEVVSDFFESGSPFLTALLPTGQPHIAALWA